MPEFFSAHSITGMSREAVRERAERLASCTEDEPVNLVRSVCDLQAGRMLCEWVAHDRQQVVDYLREHGLAPKGEDEWLIHVDLEEPPATPPINPEPD